MNEVKFGTWTVPESPLTIQYSLIVIEEIRQEVSQGFQKMARGGIEVGGVLYGRRDEGSINILAMRPIACEHALGPSFQLSAKDRAGMEEQVQRDKADPHLEQMIAVGLYVSHTRSEIALSEADLELYNSSFQAPWQVVMVVRPGRAGAMRAGFFMRESNGSIRSDASYQEFNFPDRLAGVLDRPRPDRGTNAASGLSTGDRPERRSLRNDGSAVPALSPIEAPVIMPEKLPEPRFAMLDSSVPSGPRKAKWPWLVAWAAVLIVITVVVLRYFVLHPDTEPIALTVLEHEGQLQIGWNHSARPVVSALRGSIEIADGSDTKRIALTPADLQRGSLTYQRHTGDVEVRLIVEDQGAEKTQEASRFLGHAPVVPKEEEPAKAPETKPNDDVAAENARLRAENAQQAQRIQQLERIVKIMQTRQGGAPQ